MPTAAFALEAGTRDVPAKEISVPTADVMPPRSGLKHNDFVLSFATVCTQDISDVGAEVAG